MTPPNHDNDDDVEVEQVVDQLDRRPDDDERDERDGPPAYNLDDRMVADRQKVPTPSTHGSTPAPPETPRAKLVVEAPPSSWSTVTYSLDNVAANLLDRHPGRVSAVVVNVGTSTVRLAPSREQVPTGFRLAAGASFELAGTAPIYAVAVDSSGVPAAGTTGEVDVAAEYR